MTNQMTFTTNNKYNQKSNQTNQPYIQKGGAGRLKWPRPPIWVCEGCVSFYSVILLLIISERNFIRYLSKSYFIFVYIHDYYVYLFRFSAKSRNKPSIRH